MVMLKRRAPRARAQAAVVDQLPGEAPTAGVGCDVQVFELGDHAVLESEHRSGDAERGIRAVEVDHGYPGGVGGQEDAQMGGGLGTGCGEAVLGVEGDSQLERGAVGAGCGAAQGHWSSPGCLAPH
jgi:hypothetical protein